MLEEIKKSIKDYFEGINIQKLYILFAVLSGVIFSLLLFPFGNTAANGNREIYIESIPYNDIHFGSGTFTLDSLQNTSIVSKSGFGYIPKVKAEFDMTGLDEKDRYWVIRDGNINFKCLISSEMNSVKDLKLAITNVYFKSDKLCLEFTGIDRDEWRYSFDDMLVSFRFSVIRNKRENVDYNDITVTKYETDDYVFMSDPNSFKA